MKRSTKLLLIAAIGCTIVSAAFSQTYFGSAGIAVDEGTLYTKNTSTGANTAITATAAQINAAATVGGTLTGVTATAAEVNAVADLSVTGAIPKCKVIPITTTPTGAEQDTGVDLPAKAILLDVFINVTTAEATGGTKTIDVGLLAGESGGDTNGFLAGISVSATGLKQGLLTGGAETLGDLMKTSTTDSNADTVNVPSRHLSDSVTAKSIVYDAGSNDWAEFRGSIILYYIELP